MRPKQLTVKLRMEFGPGIPSDVSDFHQPHALKAILEAFLQTMTESNIYPNSSFIAKSDGITAHLTPTNFSVGAEPTIPTVHHVEYTATVKLEGKEVGETKHIPAYGLVFPTDRSVLEEIKKGLRHTSIVPVPPGLTDQLSPGAKVTFVEARADPFGEPIPVAGGERLTVTLTKAKDAEYQWAGRQLYTIGWDTGEEAPLRDAN